MDPRPDKTPWLTPYLTVADAARAIDFYRRAFGFVLTGKSEQNERVQHAELAYRDQLIVMLVPEGAWGATARAPATLGIEAPQSFYVYCDDVDALYEAALAAGAKGVTPPGDMFWGDRFCLVEDPDGYRWGFARHLSA